MKETTAQKTAATGTARRGLGRRFTVFQSGVLCSDAGDGLYRFGVPLLALAVTRSPSEVALVATATRLPWLLFGLLGGVLVDRFGPPTVMLWAGAVRTALVLALMVAAWQDMLSVPLLIAAALLVGTAGVMSDLAAQTWTPRLVPSELLPRANARIQSIQITVGQLFGPAFGGFLVPLGMFVPMLLAAVGYGVTSALAGVVARMRPPETTLASGGGGAASPSGAGATVSASGSGRRRDAASLVSELRDGLVYFLRRRDVGRLAALGACTNFGFAAMITLLPLWVIAPGPLGMSTLALGLMVTAIACGGLFAGACGPRVIARVGAGRVLRTAAPLTGLGLALVAIGHAAAAVVGLLLYGAAVTFGNLVVLSYRQRTVPAELYGRVNAAYRWACWGAMPLGAGAAGVLSTTLGLSASFALTGTFTLVAALLLPPRGRLEES
ncbi:MFS transporter [Streptomyces sp. NRRL S-448]|uniref:MFS transporter n=1 Tax=Streptomyces sp. NRRL S-448 TaxID=1463907 RepID=UPI003566E94D